MKSLALLMFLWQAVITPTPQIANSTVILLTATTNTNQGTWTTGCDPKFGVPVASGPRKGWCEDTVSIPNANYKELTCTPLHETAAKGQPSVVATTCYYLPK